MKDVRSGLLALSVLIACVATFGAARAEEQRPVLTPFVGETTAEFEARKAGKPRPETNVGPSPVRLVAGPSGHFALTPNINGVGVRMVVDTGANLVVLSQEDANRAGIKIEPSKFTAKISTANGVVYGAAIVLKEIAIGEISVQNVLAVVVPDKGLQVSLLGMSFLSRLSRYEVTGHKLVLYR